MGSAERAYARIPAHQHGGWLWVVALCLLGATGAAIGAAEPRRVHTYPKTISGTLANPAFQGILAAGHRGAPTFAPENTLASFAKAIELGADIVELDVRATRDGHFVIFHDASVERLTRARGSIEERTLEEGRQLEIGISEFPGRGGLPIPTLEEALKALRGRAIAYLDLKTGSAGRLAHEVGRLGATDYVFIGVRTAEAARALRAASREVHLMAAPEGDPTQVLEDFLASRPTLFEVRLPHLTPALVARLRQRGIRVFTSALVAEEVLSSLVYEHVVSAGADVILTDHLDWLAPYLHSLTSSRQRRREPSQVSP